MKSVIFALALLSMNAHAMKETCKISNGYVTALGQGATKLEAKENARLLCGEKLIDQQFAQRRGIAADMTDELALACINLECEK
jgi:hypothetical protein